RRYVALITSTQLAPALWEATNCNSSPSKRNTFANRPLQRDTAFRTIVSNTGCASAGDVFMTLRISAVAACCSSASSRSRVRWSSRSCGSVVDGGAVGALRVLGVLVRCPLVGCPFPPRRCMSLPYGGPTTMVNPKQILVFAPRQDVRFGSKADICSATGHVRFAPESDRESRHRQTVISA